MLYLLDKDVRTVRWNGEPLHEATSAIVKETMNGDFTLTVKYPISDSGIYQLIQEDMLIKAPTPVLGAQLFRIKKPVEHNDHLEITAYHISDDVMQRSITPMSVTSQSCGMALSRMVQNIKTALGDFSFNSDIQDRRTFNTTETETLYSVLLDGKHSIVGTWEGELVRDNFAMTVKKSRGENRGVVITTHKNLKDYQRTKNSQNVVTRIHAKSTFKPEGAEKETTIRVTVDSPLINSYPYVNEKEYENNNAKSVEELQKWAQAKFTNQGIDKVSDAIKIEAYELDGQVVHMGDTANLKSWKHNVDALKKAIAYEFDALKEEYISLTFDDKAGTGGSRASGGLSSAADAILGVTESAQEIALEKALQNADLDFDHQAGLLRQEILDGIELAKARAEEVKQELSDTINQRFNSFDNGPLQEVKRRSEEALRNAGASSLLAQEAKRIGLDSVAKLDEFKRQATSAQTALSGDLDVLKRTVASEVNQASEYRRTTTEALSRMTGQMDGFATKSEVKQGIDGLTQTFAKMQVGGRNYYRNSQKLVTRPRFIQFNVYPYLTADNIGQDWTFSFDLKINETGTVRQLHFYHYQRNGLAIGVDTFFNPSKEWQRYSFTAKVIQGGTNPAYAKGAMAIYDHAGDNDISIRNIKFEKGTLATDWSPAPEDTDSLITEAKATFERTAQGLRTDLSAIQEYVSQDGHRQEALQRYTREESARQANAVRELISRDYVGKATYQEDVRGLERRFEAIINPQNGTIATQIANYKESVDGRFTDITSLIAGKANQTDFQRVQETSKLYERIFGSTDNGIADNVARMAMTSQLFQVEVGKAAQKGRNYYRDSEKVQTKTRFFAFPLHPYLTQENVGETWTLSFDLKINEGGEIRPLHFYHYQTNRFGIKASGDITPSKEWQRFTFTGPVIFPNDDPRYARGEMALYDFAGNNSYSVRRIKFERGSVATPWSPAPEDTDEAIRTVQSQLAGSWAVQNINDAGDLISGINLGANGHNRFVGKLTHITGETLIDKAVIKSAMIDKLKTANFEAGSVTTVILDAEAVTAEKLKVDQAFFNKLVANEAYLSQLFAKQAFINRVQSVAIDASQVRSGILSGDRIYGGTIRGANIYGGTLTGHTQIQLGTYGSFDTVNGGIQINVPRTVNAKDGLGVQFIGSYGRGENVPYGLFIYKDSDFTVGGTAETSDDFLLTVEGYINAKGIGWLKTGKGSVNGKTTGTIGFWNSDNVSLSFGGSGNDIYYSYNGTAYSLWSVVNQHFSDRRLKENIIDCEHKALDYIHQFQFKEYDWKKQEDRPQQAHTKIGLIAQEVQKVDPTLVYENGDTLNLDNLRLTNIALKAIQELALENRKLTHRLENLENERRTA
ncbi:TPA: phage tail spike protein [Streptococcus pneumoniae]